MKNSPDRKLSLSAYCRFFKITFVFFIALGLVTGIPFCLYANDPPHNEASGIDCSDCHGQTLLDDQSPFYTDNNSAAAYNSICTGVCHNADPVGYETGNEYHGTTAPLVLSHLSGSSVIKCTVCHHNHDQYQIYSGKNEKSKFFIATGTLDTNATIPLDYDPGSGRTTIAYATLAATDPAGTWPDLSLLAKKTGDGRGAMLVPNHTSRKRWPIYIIKSIDTAAKTITVKGHVSAASNLAIFYGQVMRTSVNYESVAGMPRSVKYYDRTGANGFAHTDTPGVNDSTVNGICQICHTQTEHWRNDGTLSAIGIHADYNGKDCMACHPHTLGFRASCNSCHGYPPVTDLGGGPDGLVGHPAATGSSTAGAHEKHATDTSYSLTTDGNFGFQRSGYNYPCETCHSGGMPESPINDDYQIQMGFDINGADGTNTSYDGHALQNGYTYQGTNNTATTGNGSMTCANTYCHSDGTSVSSGVVPANSSPAWGDEFPDKCPQSDGSACYNCHIYPHPDGYSCDDCHSYPFPNDIYTSSTVPYPYKCNQCHGYPPAYNNDEPKANTGHLMHGWVSKKMQCSTCHYATIAGGMAITNPENHANGIYDVVPDPNIARFEYTYDIGGGKCANIECHNSHPSINDWETHGQQGARANTHWWQGYPLWPTNNVSIDRSQQGCRSYQLSVDVDYFIIGQPSFVTPFTFTWDFGDGTTGQGNPVTHTWPDNGPYTATVTIRDSNNHPDYGSRTMDFSSDLNMRPTGGMDISMDGLTATLTDLSYDPDYDCNAGGGSITINWGDGNSLSDAVLSLTGVPSNQEFTHTYAAAGTYTVTHFVRDNVLGPSNMLSTNVEAGSQAAYITISGTLLRDDGNYNRGLNGADVTLYDENMDLVPFDPVADWPNRNPDATNSSGNWGFSVEEGCYTVEVEQGYGGFYATYFYPSTIEVCETNTAVPFIIDEAPNVPTQVPEKSHNNIDADPAIRVQLEWGPITDPPNDSPVEYQVEVTEDSVVVGNSGWISETFARFTWTPDQYWSVTAFKWKVKARETVYPNRETYWSAEERVEIYQKGNYGAGSGAGCGFQGTNYCTEDDF